MVSGDLPHVKLGALRLVDQHGTALSILVVAKAAPCSLSRFEYESPLYARRSKISKVSQPACVRVC
jgi:hypothetical protein